MVGAGAGALLAVATDWGSSWWWRSQQREHEREALALASQLTQLQLQLQLAEEVERGPGGSQVRAFLTIRCTITIALYRRHTPQHRHQAWAEHPAREPPLAPGHLPGPWLFLEYVENSISIHHDDRNMSI